MWKEAKQQKPCRLNIKEEQRNWTAKLSSEIEQQSWRAKQNSETEQQRRTAKLKRKICAGWTAKLTLAKSTHGVRHVYPTQVYICDQCSFFFRNHTKCVLGYYDPINMFFTINIIKKSEWPNPYFHQKNLWSMQHPTSQTLPSVMWCRMPRIIARISTRVRKLLHRIHPAMHYVCYQSVQKSLCPLPKFSSTNQCCRFSRNTA